MNRKVATVDDCAQRQGLKEINELFVNVLGVLGLACFSNWVHSVLKLKEVVITLP